MWGAAWPSKSPRCDGWQERGRPALAAAVPGNINTWEHRSKESGVEEELIAAAAARSGVPVKDGTATIADAQGAQASLTELILWSTS